MFKFFKDDSHIHRISNKQWTLCEKKSENVRGIPSELGKIKGNSAIRNKIY